MLKVLINTKTDMVTFFCPKCNLEDVIYTSQPRFCYNCGSSYDFYISRMLLFSSERKYYHFNHEDDLTNGMLLK